MNIDEIVTKICVHYGLDANGIAKKKHGKSPSITYGETVRRLVAQPTVGLEHTFPEVGRTTITALVRHIFPDKPLSKEFWGSYLLRVIDLKKCPQCSTIKNSSEYFNKEGTPSGLRNICKECHFTENKIRYDANPEAASKYRKEYYIANKETITIRQKKYYIDHKEYLNIKSRQYYIDNKEKLTEISKQYYLNNLLYYREYRKKYYAEHKAEYASYDAKRRAVKLNATPAWASLKEIKKIYMGRKADEHVDHIIPLQGELVCGLHCEHNLQYLSAEANLVKSNKFNIETYEHTREYQPPYLR